MATNLKFYKGSSTPTGGRGSIWFDTNEKSIKVNTGSWTRFATVKEAFLEWGGSHKISSYSPIDACLIPTLVANRFAFAYPGGITIEYSRDRGATWLDYGFSDMQKTGLFTTPTNSIFIGGKNEPNVDKSNHMVRVTINSRGIRLYTALNKFALHITTNGSINCYCSLDIQLESDRAAGNDVWKSVINKQIIRGWSGWNILNVSEFTTYGNTSTNQYSLLRFTFGCESHAPGNSGGFCVNQIYGFGGFGWNTPSTLASTGHLYSFDVNKNATFPGQITATQFNGKATSASTSDALVWAEY